MFPPILQVFAPFVPHLCRERLSEDGGRRRGRRGTRRQPLGATTCGLYHRRERGFLSIYDRIFRSYLNLSSSMKTKYIYDMIVVDCSYLYVYHLWVLCGGFRSWGYPFIAGRLISNIPSKWMIIRGIPIKMETYGNFISEFSSIYFESNIYQF